MKSSSGTGNEVAPKRHSAESSERAHRQGLGPLAVLGAEPRLDELLRALLDPVPEPHGLGKLAADCRGVNLW